MNGQCKWYERTAPKGPAKGDFWKSGTWMTLGTALSRKKGNKTAEIVWIYAFIFEIRKNRSRYQFAR